MVGSADLSDEPRGGETFSSSEVEVVGKPVPRGDEVLTREALTFLAELHRVFGWRRLELLNNRGWLRTQLNSGHAPGFPSETRSVRESDWKVAPPPSDLLDRRVEITGPTDRKMVINALNSGARTYMADFEDAHSPTWPATITGQVNLQDAVRRTISYDSAEGKEYRLADRTATLMVRPRGWHMDEAHLRVDGRTISASLFDFGLYLFHNARELQQRGSGAYFYLPKLEHYLEARLWNDVFRHSEEHLGLPSGSIRATVLIETLPAAFQMDEVLWELRERSTGLNCGRWDYLFSAIKQFQDDPTVIFPDRDQLTMDTPFFTAYTHLLIRTCHRRGAHAIGGMAAQIPIKGNVLANEAAIRKVYADKEREVNAGHDGTWVAHPALVPVAQRVFDAGMPGPHQIERSLPEESIAPEDLLRFPHGTVTERGVRRNTRAAFRYLAAWLAGNGCVPIDYLMEDAATAEIARTQLWQWVHHGARCDSGLPVDLRLVRNHLQQEAAAFGAAADTPSERRAADLATRILTGCVAAETLEEFLTLQSYHELED